MSFTAHFGLLLTVARVDYDQYYASLASQSTPGSAPIDDFGEEEEEDVKPSVEYLNSLNDYRKRVRSEDEDASERASKLVKTEADPTPAVNAFGELEVEDEMEGVQFGGAGAADDPVVYGAPASWTYLHVLGMAYRLLCSEWRSYGFLSGNGGAPGAHDTRRVHRIFRSVICAILDPNPLSSRSLLGLRARPAWNMRAGTGVG